MKMQNTSKWRWMLSTVVLMLSGCAATIIQPEEVIDPVPVYLLNQGGHNSLVLIADEDDVQLLTVGELLWYVDGETGFGRSFYALFRDTPAALGRTRLHGPVDPNCWVVQIGLGIRNAMVFSAPRERVDALAGRINKAFDEVDPYYSHPLNLEYIVDPRPYTLGYNSNHRVVEWLESLDLEVRGNPTLGILRPADPEHSVEVDPRDCP